MHEKQRCILKIPNSPLFPNTPLNASGTVASMKKSFVCSRLEFFWRKKCVTMQTCSFLWHFWFKLRCFNCFGKQKKSRRLPGVFIFRCNEFMKVKSSILSVDFFLRCYVISVWKVAWCSCELLLIFSAILTFFFDKTQGFQ